MRARLFSLVCLLALVVAGCGTSRTPAGESPELPPLDPQEIPTEINTRHPDARLTHPRRYALYDPIYASAIHKQPAKPD